MILLAIDTAAAPCAACTYDTDAQEDTGRAVLELGRGHAEHVMSVIAQALGKAGLSYADLDAVAVAVGPGSFTGLRVGISAARGIALARAIPAIGVTTLEALAAEARLAWPGRAVLTVLGTRPESLAAALFDASGACVEGPMQAGLADLAAMARDRRPVLAGDAAPLVAEAAGGGFDTGPQRATADISVYAQLAAGRQAGEKPRPLYLRPPDAKPQGAFALPRRQP